MVKHSCREGDWFAVPLRSGGFALGIAARVHAGGQLLGYFFGPSRSEQPTLADVEGLRPSDAVLVGMFGHLGIRNGTWPVLGTTPDWDRSQWPLPVFLRHEELNGRTLEVRYDDADPSRVIDETPVEPNSEAQGPEDGLMGAGFVEQRLTRLLG